MNYTSPAIGAAHLSRKSVESVLPIYVRGVTNAHQMLIKCLSSAGISNTLPFDFDTR